MMNSMSCNFSWEPFCAPLDENEVRFYQSFEQGHVGDFVRIKVRVKHELCITPQQHPSLILPFERFLYEQIMFVPLQDFLQHASIYMQVHFPNVIIPHELMYSMLPFLMRYVWNAPNSPSGFHYEGSRIRVFPLGLDVFVQMLFGQCDNVFINNIAVRLDSIGEIQFVPASKEAIESLEKVKMENSNAIEKCSVCQFELNAGMEVTKMPCNHLYHQDCIVQWLKTSHMCPMCRYPMPTSTSG
ncbi:E3 ubiquitin-protein ligase MPSR1-like [Vicia villosa]|uniref:E3 ubiquitin-protein ligase MPSR1-like n=1 Tax=Vicia villosa TaxID=3911 RepID=UPI00273C8A61|nr:E3 ubiquitin-protein ligase MPSR1-like [Vicia villosa]